MVAVKAIEMAKAAAALESLRQSCSDEVVRELARAEARHKQTEKHLQWTQRAHAREVVRLRAGLKLCLALGMHATVEERDGCGNDERRLERAHALLAQATARAEAAEARAESAEDRATSAERSARTALAQVTKAKMRANLAERNAREAASALEAEKQTRAEMVAAHAEARAKAEARERTEGIAMAKSLLQARETARAAEDTEKRKDATKGGVRAVARCKAAEAEAEAARAQATAAREACEAHVEWVEAAKARVAVRLQEEVGLRAAAVKRAEAAEAEAEAAKAGALVAKEAEAAALEWMETAKKRVTLRLEEEKAHREEVIKAGVERELAQMNDSRPEGIMGTRGDATF